jgi:hypothetical protein
VDVYIKKLLCYRFKISLTEFYDNISSDNDKFQKELKEICSKSKDVIPIDLDILWYVGHFYCNIKILCSCCKIKKYCKDFYFETEAIKNVKDKIRRKEEIDFVRKHKEIII